MSLRIKWINFNFRKKVEKQKKLVELVSQRIDWDTYSYMKEKIPAKPTWIPNAINHAPTSS